MALQHSPDLTLASLKNRAGNVVEASVQTMRAALTNVSDTVSGELYGSFFHQSRPATRVPLADVVYPTAGDLLVSIHDAAADDAWPFSYIMFLGAGLVSSDADLCPLIREAEQLLAWIQINDQVTCRLDRSPLHLLHCLHFARMCVCVFPCGPDRVVG